MSPTTEKVDIIIIGAGREGLEAAGHIKENTKFKYKIIENSFPSRCDEDAKRKHGTNLKLNEKVTSAQMDKKMEHWVVMTEKNDDQQGPVTITGYKCDGAIIVTTGNPCNVPEWVKERIIFNEGRVLGFKFQEISLRLGKCKFYSIGFEGNGLYTRNSYLDICKHELIYGDIIVGAGPAGLATAATFDTQEGGPIEYKIIEKSKHFAPLWQDQTYDKLTLQRPKDKCQLLPNKPFPTDCREYPKRDDFLKYLGEMYENLKVKPEFGEEVTDVYYVGDFSDKHYGVYSHWVVRTIKNINEDKCVRSEYKCKGVVVASGRNARRREPKFRGLNRNFPRETIAYPELPSLKKQIHSSEYKNGKDYKDKNVLVVGYGDSAIDICGDLHNEGAKPYIVVRDSERSRMVYKLAEFFPGKEHPATFPMKKLNLSLLSVLVDNFGQCKTGIINPNEDIEIDVYPDIDKFEEGSVKFKNVNTALPIDCVILATGFNDNVQHWLKEEDSFQKEILKHALDDLVMNRIIRIGFTKDGLLGIKGQAQLAAAKFGEDEPWWV